MPSDESKGSQLDAIGSLAQRQLDNTLPGAHEPFPIHLIRWRRAYAPKKSIQRVLALFTVGDVHASLCKKGCAFYLFIRAHRTC